MWDLEKFYNRAFDWLLTYGSKLVIAIVLLIIGQWLIRLLNRWLRNIFYRREIDQSLATFFQNLLAVAMQVLLLLIVMQILGLQMTIFASIITAFGVAAGLALSGTLQNFASGVLILLLKPYRVGDTIITQGQQGTVSSIQLFYTIVTTFDNKTVVVPNSKLSNEIIINLSREGNRRVDVEIKFMYTVDFENAKKIIQDTLPTVQNILKEPAPRIGVSMLEADGFKVIVKAWTPAPGFEEVRLVLQEKIMQTVKGAGIKLFGM